VLDLLVVTAVRSWFTRSDAPAWFHAHTDPVVGPARRPLHNNPAHPWTVAALAREVSVTRAVLAQRSTDLVGEPPPLAFLTGSRLTLAANLRQPGRPSPGGDLIRQTITPRRAVPR
jgi:AraC-like DNA-binding protein